MFPRFLPVAMSFASGPWGAGGRRRWNPSITCQVMPLGTSLSFSRSGHQLLVPPQASDQTSLYTWAFYIQTTIPSCTRSSPSKCVTGQFLVHAQNCATITVWWPATVLLPPPPNKPISLQLLQHLVIYFLSLDLQNVGSLCKWNHALYNLCPQFSAVLQFILEMSCSIDEDFPFVWVNNLLVCDLIFFSCSSWQMFELCFPL